MSSSPPDRRSPATARRDLNDLIRDPEGRVAESKVFAVAFKAACLYVFVIYASDILQDWTVLLVFVLTFLAPDLLKKLMAMKMGVRPLDEGEKK